MKNVYKSTTEYFLREGKTNLDRCLLATFESALERGIDKIIIFTSAGKGVKLAIDRMLSQEQFARIRLIAVTFPSNTQFTEGDPEDHAISPEMARYLAFKNVPIVRANLPFVPIKAHHEGHGILGQDFSLIGNVLSIFCGSMSLCVQAIMMACDAGHIELGEHVIAMTSDTSILARAAGTSRLLTDLIVREIICKPVLLTIGKREPEDDVSMTEPDEAEPDQLGLPAHQDE